MSCYKCGRAHLARDCKGIEGMLVLPEVKVATTLMDFSKTRVGQSADVTIEPEALVEYLMMPQHQRLVSEDTGADLEWFPAQNLVRLSGSAEQVKSAQRLLARVMVHCRWGCSESKTKRLLRPPKVDSIFCRLSPMNTLTPVEKALSIAEPVLTIGKDKSNSAVVNDALVSRVHVRLEFDAKKGGVYVADCSTNGTFLNGVRLPQRKAGSVLLSHGDELLLKDPAGGDAEFGYMVNLKDTRATGITYKVT